MLTDWDKLGQVGPSARGLERILLLARLRASSQEGWLAVHLAREAAIRRRVRARRQREATGRQD